MDLHASHPFSEAFEFASGAIGERFQNPLWRLKEDVFGARLRQAFHQVHRFGQSIVAAATQKAEHVDRGAEETASSDVSDPSLKTAKHGTDSRSTNLINSLRAELTDNKAVADAALNFLSAGKACQSRNSMCAHYATGRDTLAQSLTWTVHLLLEHPRAMDLLRSEVAQLQRGDDEPLLNFDRVQPQTMPYTLAVFYESLRLYPPVPVEIKQCIAHTTLPDGTMLPTGAIVVWSPWGFGRSEQIWGSDVDIFRPERWLEKTPDGLSESEETARPRANWKIKTRTASEFPVFNGGPRTCMGRRMAEVEAVYILASLFHQFEMTEIKDNRIAGHWTDEGRISRNSLTLPMEGGLPCYVKPRGNMT